MRLRDLEARFVRMAFDLVGTCERFRLVESFLDADGIVFLCPTCFARNGGAPGTHSILVWFLGRAVPETWAPKGRWAASGSGLDDLTLAPSIALVGGCTWHGFVHRGEARAAP